MSSNSEKKKPIQWLEPLFKLLRVSQWKGQSNPNQKLFNALLVVVLMISYVAWVLHGESLIRETDTNRRKISELNAELTYEKSKLMQESRQSRIIQKVAPLGLRDYRNEQPPIKVVMPTHKADQQAVNP
ncbi:MULTISPECIES: FtsL-like putative cell division protein [unclassified Siphonobacter]|uniref:FtsL-like putative cell division protein n=1 Tax=unclassified Siphonobacter TaxID=2635712 RepID=UPI000CAC53AA|nr:MULTISPECIES: FtsL-like putative cell division protein [unclassified Siphonobacter]MDQ1087976.1 hypothetical protein [Siphonobacter sp. SORGH_AS_1065]MDR6194125.1 hypothetical protein [Siphonobacter sp. SORGH_AS_0500]PKK36933.1 hypothetical protein BWI96_08550 [Siphonobacter sp. SORGH_AS_0500]